jgi:hypothetical protein
MIHTTLLSCTKRICIDDIMAYVRTKPSVCSVGRSHLANGTPPLVKRSGWYPKMDRISCRDGGKWACSVKHANENIQ